MSSAAGSGCRSGRATPGSPQRRTRLGCWPPRPVVTTPGPPARSVTTPTRCAANVACWASTSPDSPPPAEPSASAHCRRPVVAAHESRKARPDEERLRLQGRDGDAWQVAGRRVADEARLPERTELRVEPVQRLDLEPPRGEDE